MADLKDGKDGRPMTIGDERVRREGPGRGDTWPKVLEFNYRKYGNSRTAMRHKRSGIWQAHSWQDYYLNVRRLALGLRSLGFSQGDKLLIIGDNAPQWYYAELAAQALGGVSVGTYSDLGSREIGEVALGCDAGFAVVEDQEQVDKLLEIREGLDRIRKIIYWDYKGLSGYDDAMLLGYREVLDLGDRYDRDHPGEFEESVKKGHADDVCSIIYTSGTTGDGPKPALHSFSSIRASAEFCLNLDPWREKDNIVPSLPPAWMAEQCLAVGCHLLSASILNFYEKPETQEQDAREIGPDIVFRSARLWENQASEVQARMRETGALKKLAFRWFMPVGLRLADARQRKQRPGALLSVLYALGGLVLFGPLRDHLGLSKARICYNTGAMLSPDAHRFYHALDLPLKSIYMTTEGGMLSGARNDDIRVGTVGPVNGDRAEMTITDRGEIAYRQPAVFLGYYKDPKKTAEVLREGWFYTGDAGRIDGDGHLVLIDRANDIVRLAGGATVAPQLLESRLRFSPHIKDAWVLAGPGATYLSAIIVIDYVSVGRWANEKGLSYRNFTELSQKPEVYLLVRDEIERVNRNLPPEARVRKYANLYKELTPEEGELTRTRKLRREFLARRFRDLVLAIYDEKSEATVENAVAQDADAAAGQGSGPAAKTMTAVAIKSIDGAD